MKLKILLSAMLLLLLVWLYSPASYSQNPTCTVTLTNDTLIGNAWSFDVYILRTGTTPFNLYTFQIGLTYDNGAKNDGTITAVWSNIDSAIVAAGNIPNPTNVLTAGVIKCSSALPIGGLASDTFPEMSNVGFGTHYGTLTVTNSVPWTGLPQFTWCFNSEQYPTRIRAVVNGLTVDVTSIGTFIKGPLKSSGLK